MTKEEKMEKNLRKKAIKKKLSELQRKISLCIEMLSKARICQTLLKDEYQKLDRKLFEASPGITVVKTRKNTKSATNMATLLTDYDKMNVKEQEKALSRLLEIQAEMVKKQ
jgi:hypothetical protein